MTEFVICLTERDGKLLVYAYHAGTRDSDAFALGCSIMNTLQQAHELSGPMSQLTYN